MLFVGLAFLIYAPTLTAGFIWDDGRAITDNLALRSWHGLWNIWAGQEGADYFPLKSTVLWIVKMSTRFGPTRLRRTRTRRKRKSDWGLLCVLAMTLPRQLFISDKACG
jgi:hypothetical protein